MTYRRLASCVDTALMNFIGLTASTENPIIAGYENTFSTDFRRHGVVHRRLRRGKFAGTRPSSSCSSARAGGA